MKSFWSKRFNLMACMCLLLMLVVFACTATSSRSSRVAREATDLIKSGELVLTASKSLKTDAGQIKKLADGVTEGATQTIVEYPGSEQPLGVVFENADRIRERADAIGVTAEQVASLKGDLEKAKLASDDKDKLIIKLQDSVEDLKKKNEELESAMTTTLKRWLTIIAIGCVVGAGIAGYLRNLWIAGLFGTIAACCGAACFIIAWMKPISIGAIILIGLIVAWKMLADGATLKSIVKSWGEVFKRVPDEVKEDAKLAAAKIQGEAVSRVVHKIKARL